jgi:hypothetical protein
MGGLSAATGAGVGVQVQDCAVYESSFTRMEMLIEQRAVLAAQLPLRRRLASISRESEGLFDQVLELLASFDLHRLGLTGNDDDNVDALIGR